MQTAEQYRDEVLTFLCRLATEAQANAERYRGEVWRATEDMAVIYDAQAAVLRDAISFLPAVST